MAAIPALLTGESAREQAWKILLNAAANTNPVRRTQALTTLGTIGPSVPAMKAIEKGLQDNDTYARLTVVAALGEVISPRRIAKLQRALDNDDPEVQFVAARTLWQTGNHSGRQVLIRVLTGERQIGGPGPIKGGGRAAKDKLYNRSDLARMGVSEGIVALLGPLSMGMGFAEDLLKNQGAPQQAVAAKLLARDRDSKSLTQLEDALNGKNGGVRAAAAQSLAERRDRHALPKLKGIMLDDKSDAARFMAAASVVRLTCEPVRHHPPAPAKTQEH